MKLLHVIASPRGDRSNTLRISAAFIDALRQATPDLVVDEVDLFNQNLPAVAGDNIDMKYALMHGQAIDKSHASSWRTIERLIEDFLSVDAYLVSAPMWNFGIPYALKYYIDCIVQPGYVFRYDETGQVVPMVIGKKMVCVTSRGGDYSDSSPMHPYDFQEPYLRAIFGFIGITDLTFINGQPMDITPDWRVTATESAIAQARTVARSDHWGAPAAALAPV